MTATITRLKIYEEFRTMPATMPTITPSHFWRLPRELRDEVYQYVLTSEHKSIWRPTESQAEALEHNEWLRPGAFTMSWGTLDGSPRSSRRFQATNLFSVCKTFLREAPAIILKANTILVAPRTKAWPAINPFDVHDTEVEKTEYEKDIQAIQHAQSLVFYPSSPKHISTMAAVLKMRMVPVHNLEISINRIVLGVNRLVPKTGKELRKWFKGFKGVRIGGTVSITWPEWKPAWEALVVLRNFDEKKGWTLPDMFDWPSHITDEVAVNLMKANRRS